MKPKTTTQQPKRALILFKTDHKAVAIMMGVDIICISDFHCEGFVDVAKIEKLRFPFCINRYE